MKKIGMLLAGLAVFSAAQADFLNGDFNAYDPNTGASNALITNWTSTGYLFKGYLLGLTLPPKSLLDINLDQISSPLPLGITDVIQGTNQTLDDYFLKGLDPASTLKLPEVGDHTASINLKSQHAVLSVSGTSAKPSTWNKYGKQATALSQTIVIGNSDFSSDGKVHIHFKIAPVMENPAHAAKEQPFYAIQINNYTTGRSGANPLYFQWSYAAQPGVPWKTFSKKPTGTPPNPGSNTTYNYTDWQSYDLAFSNSDIRQGDRVELVVLAAGCSPGGHDGHIYLDQVTTQSTAAGTYALSISAEGPATTTVGGTYTYTYTYKNTGTNSVSGIYIDIHMPQAQNSPASSPPYEVLFSSFNLSSSSGNSLTSCSFLSGTNILRCTKSDALQQGASGTFQMTVTVPPDWQTSYGPINHGNYPIAANAVGQQPSISPTLGNLVQTNLIAGSPPSNGSFLEVNTSGLLIPGQQSNGPSITYTNGSYPTYSGTYTCTNKGPNAAPSATCDITNLPQGLSKGQCTINPYSGQSNSWNQPANIPVNAIVTCPVSGTVDYTTSTQIDVLVSSDASNNTNAVTNKSTVPYYIYINPEEVPASQNGSPVIIPVKVCCGRPVVLYDLVGIESDLAATYAVIYQTGNIKCQVGQSNGNYFVKIFGRPGSCTVQGTKDGQISKPFVLQTT